MSEFQDQLQAAFGAAKQRKDKEGPHWSRAILDEFAEWITKKSGQNVYARTTETGVPEGTRLVWGPLNRLGDTSTLLVVSGQGDRAIKLGVGQNLYMSKEAMQADIVSLVESEAFQESMAELERRAGEPVEGFLRSGFPRDRDPRVDVFVEVPPEEQLRLAKACLGWAEPRVAGVRVHLVQPSPIANGIFQERKGILCWLVSGGVVTKLDLPLQEDGGQLELSGEVQRET
jgi:hypothetical protein